VEDWKKWLHSKERSNINDQIDQLSQEKAEYTIYEPLVGASFRHQQAKLIKWYRYWGLGTW